MKKNIILLVIIALLAITAIASIPPCPTEDSSNCYWSAQTRGNGEGRSFVTIADQVIYIPVAEIGNMGGFIPAFPPLR